MQVDRVVRALLDRTGMSDRAVSETLGKSPAWAGLTAVAGRDPRLSTVVTVADLAGVDVVARDRATGEDIATIDPPHRERTQG